MGSEPNPVFQGRPRQEMQYERGMAFILQIFSIAQIVMGFLEFYGHSRKFSAIVPVLSSHCYLRLHKMPVY